MIKSRLILIKCRLQLFSISLAELNEVHVNDPEPGVKVVFL